MRNGHDDYERLTMVWNSLREAKVVIDPDRTVKNTAVLEETPLLTQIACWMSAPHVDVKPDRMEAWKQLISAFFDCIFSMIPKRKNTSIRSLSQKRESCKESTFFFQDFRLCC